MWGREAPTKQEREAFPKTGEQTVEANHPVDGLPERICDPPSGNHMGAESLSPDKQLSRNDPPGTVPAEFFCCLIWLDI